MNEQLLAVKRLMDRTGVEWWVDSGTLLGLVRDGDVLPWDNDIDISIWAEDSNEVRKILEGIAPDEGHAYRHLTLRGESFMHLLKPVEGGDGLRVTIMAYHPSRDGERAICPGYYQKQNPFTAKSVGWILAGAYRTPLRVVARKIRRRSNDRTLLVTKWPFTSLFQKMYFEVPSKYFSRLESIKGFPAPHDMENYLAYRYGPDWKTPKPRTTDWVWHRDDGSVRKGDFVNLIN